MEKNTLNETNKINDIEKVDNVDAKNEDSKKHSVLPVILAIILAGIIFSAGTFVVTRLYDNSKDEIYSFASLDELTGFYSAPTLEELEGKTFVVGDEIYDYDFDNSEWVATGEKIDTPANQHITQGINGKDGKDATSLYELAVENGYTGTSEEFVLSIAKFSGTNANDKDIYEIMKELGYNGTREEFEATFQGEAGRNGLNGLDGRDGIDGKDGKDGRDGKDGKDGLNGKNGKDGKDGEDGEDGRDGLNGKDGKDGEDGTIVELSENNTWVLNGLDTQVLARAYTPEIITLENGRKVWAVNGEAIKTENDEYCYAESSDIDIQVTPTGEVQWAYTTGDDTEWKTLFETSEIVGPSVEFRVNNTVSPPAVEWKIVTADDTAWTVLYTLDELALTINPVTYEWELFGSPIGISAEVHNPYLEAGDPITVNGQEIIPQYWWVWDPAVDNGDGTYGAYVNTMIRANAVDGRNGV